MPRACWGSQSTSGRSQRRLFRFTSQFRRPQHLGASSGCSAQSRVPQAGLYRPHRSSGRMAGACGVRGTWWRSCGDGGAFMAGVSSFGCGGPGWSSSSNADATSRQPPAEEPHSSQRSNNARIRASPRGALRAGSRTSGRKSARSARPVCARRYKITSARKSLTLVCVGPVTSRSPIASK